MQEVSSQPPIEAQPAVAHPLNVAIATVRSAVNSSRTKLALSLAALLLVGVALLIVGQAISFADIWSFVQRARTEWIVVTAGLLVLSQVIRVIRSMRLLNWEVRPRTSAVVQALSGAQVINWLSPVRAGDVWRIWYVGQQGNNSLLWTASSVVLEKGADSVVLAAFAAILLFAPLPAGVSVPVVRLLTTVVICLLAFGGISAVSSSKLRNGLLARVPRLDRWLSRASLNTLLPRQLQGARRPVRWLEMLGYSTAIWGLAVLTNMALAEAFDLQVGFTTQLLLLITLQTTTVLAPVPGNVGVFPLLALTVFGAAGVPAAGAVAFGSVLYVLVYGVLLALAAVAFAPTLRAARMRSPKTAKTAKTANHAKGQ
jgi:uncharacterized membrane protein YbhN (UPF0104 family)